MAIAAFAAVSERSRKIRSGRSGEGERSSITMNTSTRAVAPARSPIVVAEPQPSVRRTRRRVHEQHQTRGDGRRTREVEVTMREPSTTLCSSTGARAIAATPTGTLMKKTQDQLRYDVSTPPSRTPAAAPLPEAAP